MYDAGPNKVFGTIVAKGLNYTDGRAWYNWVKDSILFSYSRFSIGAIANLDLGKGKSTAITNVRYNGGNNLADVFRFVAPGQFDVSFPYKFLR